MFKIKNMLNFKVLGLMLVFLMILGVASSLPIYASEPSGDFKITTITIDLTEADSVIPTLDENLDATPEESSEIPMGGIGMAQEESFEASTKNQRPPSLTSVRITDEGWLANGNWGVEVTIMGMARNQRTTLKNKLAKVISEKAFFNPWTNLFVGEVYLFDCGKILRPGDYKFETTFLGIAYPFNQITARVVYTFDYK